MNRRRGVIGAIAIIVQLSVVATFVALSHSGAGVGATGSIAISGTVTNQSGTGVANVAVTADTPGSTTVVFGPVNTAADGTYTLFVDAGSYDFHFDPTGGSSLNSVVDSGITVFSNQIINIQLVPTRHIFSGIVTDNYGDPVGSLPINLNSPGSGGSNASAITGFSDGSYSMNVLPAVYNSVNFGQPGCSGYCILHNTPNGPIATVALGTTSADGISEDLTNGNVTQNFTLNFVKLTIFSKDGSGNPEAGVETHANVVGNYPVNGGSTTVTSGNNNYTLPITFNQGGGSTNANGSFTLLVPQGAVYAPGSVCTLLLDGTRACNKSTVTASSDQTVTLQEPLTYVYSGVVSDNYGDPVGSLPLTLASPSAGGVNVSTMTGFSDGSFSMNALPATYGSVSFGQPGCSGYCILRNTPNGPIATFALGSTSSDGINVDMTTGSVTQDFTLNFVRLTITSTDGTGNPEVGVDVHANASGNSAGATTVNSGSNSYSLPITFNNGGGATNTSGSVTLLIPQGAVYAPGGICSHFTDGANICNTATVTASSDLTETLQEPLTYTFSGTVTDNYGDPVGSLPIALSSSVPSGLNGGANTGFSNGVFSMRVKPAVYGSVSFGAPGCSGSCITGTTPNGRIAAMYLGSGSNDGITEDLTTSNVTQNFTLNLIKLTIVPKDSSGNPQPNVDFSAFTSGNNTGTTIVASGNNTYTLPVGFAGYSGTTSSNGMYTVLVPLGTVYAPGGICTHFLDGSHTCNAATVTASSDLTETFQEAPPIPTIPTNLTAFTPVQTPGLDWTASTGADSYNIYRDGTIYAFSTGTSFTDTNASQGSYTYYVTAVNAGGESSASNSVTIVVNNTPPTTSASLSPSPFTDGTYSNPVTVTLSAVATTGVSVSNTFYTIDGGSQQTYSSPFTVTSGGSHTITYWSTDNSGLQETANTKSFTITVPPSAPANLIAASPVQYPSLSWNVSSGATSYNIYLNSVKVGSSSTTSYTDSSAREGIDSYTVTAVNEAGESSSSSSVSVLVNRTKPTITYVVNPAANSAGWNNTNVTVTFSCTDNGTGVGIASCTAPVTLNTNGSNQKVTGMATDNAGNTSSVTTAEINIDQSVPMVGTPSWSANPVITGNPTTLSDNATASDTTLSPITGGEYYIGTSDPGQGHGTAMAFSSGSLSATVGSNLSPGTYQFNVRAVSAAGQWSSAVSTNLVVKQATVAPNITSANNYSTGVRRVITSADFTFTTTGTPAPSLSENGTLPNGLSFTDNGNGTANFTGMVAAGTAGTYNMTITTSNSAGTKTQSFTLTITNTDSAPTTIFPSTNNLTFAQGSPMSITFTATGNGKNSKIFLYSGTMPPGINLHDNKDGTASFSGTPTTKGTYTFTLEAQNSHGVTYQTFIVTIN